MRRLRKYLKTEMDVELFACTHGVCMIFGYGLLLWLAGDFSIPFLVILEMLAVAYAMAWTQKALFWQEREYGKREYILREILWNILPMIYIPATGMLCGWFRGMATWAAITFYIFMDCYVLIVWLLLRYVNEEDTKELNRLIRERKNKTEDSEEKLL